jgi:hypothetical protein
LTASASWEESSKQKSTDFQEARDCQSIAGFLLTAGLRGPAKRKVKTMNANNKRVPTEFGPETRFEVRPLAPAPFRAAREAELEWLKTRLLDERLGLAWNPEEGVWLRRAASEAAALAWVTPYPLLVFPALFEEKAESLLRQAARQECVRERSRELLTV